ncbi:MAG: sigma-70 family RNA polymerase sigma factor [Candidatus Saccharimonas sp.]|nr:sigma-70 family RNA polymerase sigma factor [Planctomycetaceae bacterium]
MATADSEIADLIPLARAGDAAALGRLLDLQRDYLRGLAVQQLAPKLKGRLDGSDIVQQTCLSVHKQIGEFVGTEPAEFVAWLRQIHERNIRNAARNQLQAQKRAVDREESLEQQNVAGQETSPSQILLRDEEASQLRAAMEHLPDDEREAVRLRYFENWSLPQIGEHLELTPDAVVWLMKRSMKHLKQHLKDA